MQNKLASTLKQFILTITGNAEMSRDVLHKQMNFIYQNDSDYQESNLYKGKNYSISLIKLVSRRNINLKNAIRLIEERFLDTPDKDFLVMIIDSMMKGQQVKIKKVLNKNA